MKIHTSSILWLFTLGMLSTPAIAVEASYPITRAVAPGEFSVKSIDEQKLSPEIKESMRAHVRLMREHKVIPASDHQIPDFAAAEGDHKARKKKLERLIEEKGISISPATVDATSLKGQTLVGAIPGGVYNGKSWSAISRMFQHTDLGYVVLEETDLTAGGGVVFTKETINAEVNGAPAVLISRKGSEKKTITSLTWFANGILYLLYTPGIDEKSRSELLNIARSVGK